MNKIKMFLINNYIPLYTYYLSWFNNDITTFSQILAMCFVGY